MKQLLISFLFIVSISSCTKQADLNNQAQTPIDPTVSSVNYYQFNDVSAYRVQFSVNTNVSDTSAVSKLYLYRLYPAKIMIGQVNKPMTGNYLITDHLTDWSFALFYHIEYNLEYTMKDGRVIPLPKFSIQ